MEEHLQPVLHASRRGERTIQTAMRHLCYIWRHENSVGKMGQFFLWPFLAGWGAGFFYIRIVNWYCIRFEQPDKDRRLPFSVRNGFVKSLRIGRTYIWLQRR